MATESSHSADMNASNDSDLNLRGPKMQKKVVIGYEVLRSIWKVTERMSLPSWIGRPPAMLGSSQHGKLSADQWRTTCTTTLVSSLGRLWGSSDATDRQRQMLSNYFNLVSAIKLAHLRTLNPFIIHNYHHLMKRYLTELQVLYPEVGLTISQHLSLHVTALLKDWGPVHSWRCFPFERYIGMLQKIKTNDKFGTHACSFPAFLLLIAFSR